MYMCLVLDAGGVGAPARGMKVYEDKDGLTRGRLEWEMSEYGMYTKRDTDSPRTLREGLREIRGEPSWRFIIGS